MARTKIQKFIAEKVFNFPPETPREFVMELPSEEEKRKEQEVRVLHEKLRDVLIENRKLKAQKKEEDLQKKLKIEEKKLINDVIRKAKTQKKEEAKNKVIYRLEYPHKRPFMQYNNGKRRELYGFEITETKDGTPLFNMLFYANELKKVVPLHLSAQELTFFFKNITGLATQHHTGIIPLNVDEIDGRPIFINTELDFLKSMDLRLARANNEIARKDAEIKKLRSQMGNLQEIQSEQEKDLSDRDMALRYAEKDSENKSARLERVMQINNEIADKLRTDHIDKHMTEVKAAQTFRTLLAYERNTEALNQRLQDAFSSDAYDVGRKDALDMVDRVTRTILAVQSATKQPVQKIVAPAPVKQEKPFKEEK